MGDAANPNARASSLDALIDEVRRNARAAGDRPLKVTVSAHENVKYSQLRELLDRLEKSQNVDGVSVQLNR